MDDELYKESALADTVIFKSFNQNATMVTTINNCIKNSIMIEPKHIEEQLLQIGRTHISPLSDAVVNAYKNGNIIILYSKISKVPQALPFTIAKTADGIKAFVFVNNYGNFVQNARSVDAKEYLNIPMKDLYVLMEGAFTALKYAENYMLINRNLGLMKTCAQAYSSMCMRILNKEYTLSIDQLLYDRVSFVMAKFFLCNVWGATNNDVIVSYALSSVLNPNRADLTIVNDSYDNANITNIDELMAFLKTLSPRLESINMRYFTQCYINTFKAGAIFSMECLPYFLYVIECSLIGSFLVNQPLILDSIKNIRGISAFYQELSKCIL